ncbi:hypothetical protein O6H91_02G092500 [Diphasiastrum complanatum]|uniref:Uncharacterized protein n=7 Tax=Diphasiastrum complanatum TaxID=34168 RepID=A0ACC2EIA2_DIPCM|nr:hypothetical protein O6H91_02G092500 [Diphasiastrum complanatum]KAJ7566208.1 hypothetical protein O6H91_02G092500 [Diphasiastrum complanatum]KAJ7566209.1 hypothetical protein O6H91_02G092500 [Diphasiastrum complanatum]KAJ7566210.1 hypothetical protein O6H91_02G092500 [Diphasiastrum complanatum]KAJ7566211.1 hypothetical protein O6H91_02G092500 [Diphasiastrum complanatum]
MTGGVVLSIKEVCTCVPRRSNAAVAEPLAGSLFVHSSFSSRIAARTDLKFRNDKLKELKIRPRVKSTYRWKSECVRASASNGSGSRSSNLQSIESQEKGSIKKYQADLANRITSGEFTVAHPKYQWFKEFRYALANLGPVGRSFAKTLANAERGIRRQKSREMPEASGDVKAVIGEPMFIPLYKLYLTYGGVFRLTFGPKSFVIVSDAAVAKHLLRDNAKGYSKGILAEILEFVMGKGLIPADAEVWRVRRRAIVPALHRKYVAAMMDLFGKSTQNLCTKLDIAINNGEDVEMESLFSKLTLDIIGKAVFNYDFDSLSHDEGIVEAVYVALREAEARSTAIIPYWNLPFAQAIFPRQRKVATSLKLINDTLDTIITTCKKIVEEEDVDFHDEYMSDRDPSILHFLLASGDEVSSKQLRDDLMTLLIAGHETTAAVLTWTFYLLSQNPIVVEKLQSEVDATLGERMPTVADMKNLKYTTRVINESMRLYPQPPVLIRRALEDDKLGKFTVKKGDDIFISIWNLHRSPSYWVNPEEFNPERWPLDGPDPNEVTQNFRYLPFGGGQRKCVGDMFATYESITAVAMLARRYNFDLAVDAPPVGMTTGATIHTSSGLKMTVTRRARPVIFPVMERPIVTAMNKNGSVARYDAIKGSIEVLTAENGSADSPTEKEKEEASIQKSASTT